MATAHTKLNPVNCNLYNQKFWRMISWKSRIVCHFFKDLNSHFHFISDHKRRNCQQTDTT